MPRSLLSQRYNDTLFLVKKQQDDEFCRLFWNPFATPQTDDEKIKTVYKPKGQRKKRSKAGGHRCPDCTATFPWPANLKYHVAFHHTGEQLNVCLEGTCGLNFELPYQLANHQRTSGHHNWEVACPVCGKLFRSARFLARHTVAACNRYIQAAAAA